jgi:carboxyl-terminal processing protease
MPRKHAIAVFVALTWVPCLAAWGQPAATPSSLTPEQVEDGRIAQQGFLAGIGANLQQTNGQIVIGGVFQGSPAEKAGLKAGQVITTINGIPTATMALKDAVKLIRGPKGSNVALILGDPATAKTRQVVLVRDIVALPPDVTGRILNGRVGLLRVEAFSQETPNRVSALLRSFGTNGVQGIVLDLRNNGGGSLAAVIQVAGLFAGKKPILFLARDANAKQVRSIHATVGAQWPGPLVVVVNGSTANGGELLASALQTSDRALVVGQKTYGRAISESLELQPDGSSKRVVAARFLTAGGDPIDGIGITPDVTLDATVSPDEALRKAVEVLSGKTQ